MVTSLHEPLSPLREIFRKWIFLGGSFKYWLLDLLMLLKKDMPEEAASSSIRLVPGSYSPENDCPGACPVLGVEM